MQLGPNVIIIIHVTIYYSINKLNSDGKAELPCDYEFFKSMFKNKTFFFPHLSYSE